MNLIKQLLLIILAASCAGREKGWDKKTETIQLSAAERNIIKNEAYSYWQQRSMVESLEEAMTKYELVISSDLNDYESLLFLSRGHYLLADSTSNEALQLKDYEKAISYGELALATNPVFKEAVADGASVEEAAKYITAKEASAAYWTALSLHRWVSLQSGAARMNQKSTILALMDRAQKLRPDFFYGAFPRFWGEFREDKDEFEKSLRMGPEFLETKVRLVEHYWMPKKNKTEFERILKEVSESTLDKHPVLGPENRLAKVRAMKLLAMKKKIFD